MSEIQELPSWNKQVSHTSANQCESWNKNFVAVECNRTDAERVDTRLTLNTVFVSVLS